MLSAVLLSFVTALGNKHSQDWALCCMETIQRGRAWDSEGVEGSPPAMASSSSSSRHDIFSRPGGGCIY